MLTSVVTIIGAMVLWAVLHSLTAANWFKELMGELMGKQAARRYYRLLYNVVSGVTFLPVMAVVALLPDRGIYTLPGWVLFITVPIQLAALLLLVITVIQVDAWHFIGLRQLSETVTQQKQSGTNETKSTEQLVVTGMYAWVRHPLYTLSMVVLWLAPIMTVNALTFNLMVTLYFYIGSMFEERKLVREYGEVYVAHQRKVPRLFPIPPAWQREE